MAGPWASPIVPLHYEAILSEGAGSFNRAFLLAWIEKYKSGFFLRDEDSPLDCLLLTDEKFFTLYYFNQGDVDAMFRRVTAYDKETGETS